MRAVRMCLRHGAAAAAPVSRLDELAGENPRDASTAHPVPADTLLRRLRMGRVPDRNAKFAGKRRWAWKRHTHKYQ